MSSPHDRPIRFTNCRLAKGSTLVYQDLLISPSTGRILDTSAVGAKDAAVYDLGGRILAPGFIEVQINGAYGVDFSVPTDDYPQRLADVNRKFVKTGVTSYLPTITSQRPEVYRQVLPHLRRKSTRNPEDGSEVLGVHAEGPFISPEKRGCHKLEVLQRPLDGIRTLEHTYGTEHLNGRPGHPPTIRLLTLAPELDPTDTVIPALTSRGIIPSAGHSAAKYEEMQHAVKLGVRMVTHLFNAIQQPHHRDPGVFGILGAQEGVTRPWYGIIADGVHVHPSMVRLAYEAHPEGCVLVSDAMGYVGCEDGEYPFTNGDRVVKRESKLTLKGTETIAGSAVLLEECVNNMVRWTGAGVAEVLACVTEKPAMMLGIEGEKGTLTPGADADLVVLSEEKDKDGKTVLRIDEVWKFGKQVHCRDGAVKAKL